MSDTGAAAKSTEQQSLADFLLARIAEDEELVTPGEGCSCEEPEPSWHDFTCAVRIVAECEAKRRIVESLRDAEQEIATLHALRLAAECLALPYADHPDYRDQWRP